MRRTPLVTKQRRDEHNTSVKKQTFTRRTLLYRYHYLSIVYCGITAMTADKWHVRFLFDKRGRYPAIRTQSHEATKRGALNLLVLRTR